MRLEARELIGGYGARMVLDGVSFTVAPGEALALLGPNGCGKSTLLRLMARQLKPFGGVALLDGRELRGLGARELARRLAFLPQSHQAAEDLTVGELVGYGRFPHGGLLGGGDAAGQSAIARALEWTRLGELRERRLGTLSGGECQRAWLAMTLAQEPQALLLDEPTTYLDVRCQLEIAAIVRRLCAERRTAVIMALHDMQLAALCADRLVLLRGGRVHACGAPSETLTPETLRAVFGVECEVGRTPGGRWYCIPVEAAR